jgi:hypothetical protein
MKIKAIVIPKDDKEIAPGALRMSSQVVPVTVGFDGTKVVGSATVYSDGTAELEIDAPVEQRLIEEGDSGVLGLGFVVEKDRWEGDVRIIEKLRPVTVGVSAELLERLKKGGR